LTDKGDEVACGQVASGDRVSAEGVIKIDEGARRDLAGREAVGEGGVG
jgi:hypothetical protein